MNEIKSKKTKLRGALVKAGFYAGRFNALLYGIKLSLFFKDVFNSAYSGWLYGKFKKCGTDLNISYPMNFSGLDFISIGDNFTAGPRLRIEAHHRFLNTTYSPQIIIGNNVNINFDCHIGCIGTVEIGNNVLIGSKVLIMDHQHGATSGDDIKYPPGERPLVTKGPVKIGDNVWIGEGCIILPGVEIGANCIIGGNAVVTKSFGDNLVIGGNPARVIKALI